MPDFTFAYFFKDELTMIRLDATSAAAAGASGAASATCSRKKGTVIMLHGWAQNARVFHNKTLKLAKKICNAGYDVIYPEAPHILPMKSTLRIEDQPVEITNGGRKNARAWFTYNRIDPCDTSESQTGKAIEYIGLDESLGLIDDVIRGIVETGDKAADSASRRKVVVLLGFSQGGTFAHVLASLARDMFRKIDGVICIGAFPAKHMLTAEAIYRPCLTQTIGIKSLHVIGRNDTSVRPNLSNDLASLFQDPLIYWHEKGHLVPSNSAACHAVIAFLASL